MNPLYIVVDKSANLQFKSEDYKKADGAQIAGSILVDNKVKLRAFSMPQLVKLYNELSGKKLKKFETKEIGISRLWAFLMPGNGNTAPKPKTEKQAPKAKAKGKVKVPGKPAKTSKPSKKKDDGAPKKVGIGGFIRQCIVDGKGMEETMEAVKAEFPDGNTTKNSYYFYRSKLKAEGLLPLA